MMQFPSHGLGRWLWAGLLLLAGCGGSSSPVQPTPPPPDAPTLTCPADITQQATDTGAIILQYTVPPAAGGAPPVSVSCTPPPGTSITPGSTTVTCTATDRLGRTATCAFSVRLSITPRLRYTRFMAFGDSLTSGKAGALRAFSVEDYPGSYPTQLSQLLTARYTAQSITVIKQGWPGELSSEGMQRLPSALSREHPEVLLLMEGANDISSGSETAVYAAANNVRDMVRRARLAGIEVLLANLPPQRPEGPRGRNSHLVPLLNQELAFVAAQTGVTLVDVYSVLAKDLTTNIDADGLHPTLAGNQRIAETFFAAIKAAFEMPSTPPASVRRWR